jgi:hypothetical protein
MTPTLIEGHSHKMPDYERECAVLRDILKTKNKNFVCPKCLFSYVRSDLVFAHCRQKAAQDKEDWIHKGLGAVRTENDFGNFLTSLTAAVGWEMIPVEMLPFDLTRPGPRSYGACLGLDFIIEMMTCENPSPTAKYDLMTEIVRLAERHHA